MRQLAALLVLLLPLRPAFAEVTPRESRPNVLLISVDTLRPDHLSLYGYSRSTSPQISKYFARADVYRRAYTSHACTPPSAVSLLTGRYPASHGVRRFLTPLAAEVPTLPEYFRAAGYQTAAVVSNYVLRGQVTALSSRFDVYDDVTDEAQPTRKDFYERRASRTTDAALSWLRSEHDAARPHFLWVHYMDPHSPYIPAETITDFRHDTPVEVDLRLIRHHTRLPGISDGAEYVDRYDEEIAYMDRHLGRLLAAYDSAGLLDKAIVVLTADHGENLIEHERYFNHCDHVWDSIMRIPLAVLIPGAERSADLERPVSIVDVAPSILRYADVEGAGEFDGVVFGERTEADVIHLEAAVEPESKSQRWGAVRGDRKWIAEVRGGRVVDRWLVGLASDPGETSRAPWADDIAWRELRARLSGAVPALAVSEEAPELSERDREAMRALGYLHEPR